MKKNIVGYLIGQIERFFNHIWRVFNKNLRTLIVFFKNNIVDFLGTHDEIKEFQDENSSYNNKLFLLICFIRIIVDPLKLCNCIHVHPFRRNLSV